MTTDKPAEFKTVLAALDIISYDGKKATAVDKDGILYSMLWKAPYIDEKMRKMQQGYYREFTCEVQGDYLIITSIKYVESPEWVKQKFFSKSGKGGGGKPRNERLIVLQSCAKLAADVVLAPGIILPDLKLKTRGTPLIGPEVTGYDFDEVMDIIIQRAIKDADTLMKAGEQK